MTASGETWVSVPQYEGFYEVSDAGLIRSLPRVVRSKGGSTQQRPSKVLKQSPGGNGYLHVSLSREGAGKTRNVHRIVCEAFHGAPNPDEDAAHRNGDKLDNRAENLYWASKSRNILDQVEHGTHIYGGRDSCAKGHKYTPETIATFPSYKGRYCRVCLANRNSSRYH